MNTRPGRGFLGLAARSAAALVASAAVLAGVAGTAVAGPDDVDLLLGDGQMTISGGPGVWTNVVPGDVKTWAIIMRNETDEVVEVTGRVIDVTEDDGGCTEPESDVDLSCGPGEGELGDAYRLSMVDSGTPVALSDASGQLPTVTVPAKSTVSRTVQLELPRATGNLVQSDELQFRMSWTAVGEGFVAAPPNAPEASGSSDGKSKLAFTGAWIAALALLGAGLLVVGTGLVMSARRRAAGEGPQTG